MAGRPKSIEETRVFDVAKPTKAKPLGTSRPVIVNHSATVTDSSILKSRPSSRPTTDSMSPSTARKVIKPISLSDEDEEKRASGQAKEDGIKIIKEPKKSAKKSKSIKIVDTNIETTDDEKKENIIDLDEVDLASDNLLEGEPQEIDADELEDLEVITDSSPKTEETEAADKDEKPVVISPTEEEKQAVAKEKNESEAPATDVDGGPTDTGKNEADVRQDEDALDDKVEGNEAESEKDSENKKDEDSVPDSSEKAEIDNLAEASQKSKQDQKAIEEQAKIDKQLQELVNSKKYFVPLAHDNSGKRNRRKWGVMLVVLLVSLTATYLAIDYKLVGAGINLPFHFFPSKHETSNTTTTTTSTSANNLINLPTSGLKLLYDPSIWTASDSIEDSNGSTISLKNNDSSSYSYGVEIKELTVDTGIAAENLNYVTSTKVISNANADVYFYGSIKSFSSQNKVSFLPECGLGAYPGNNTEGTIGNIPVEGSAWVVGISCTFYEKDGVTPVSFDTIEEAQSWISNSSAYQNIKTLLSGFKY